MEGNKIMESDMASRHITYQEVKKYIGGKRGNCLRRDLQRDYRKHRFSREAYVEVCTYYYLRRLLKPDSRCQIFARAFRGKISRFPDITILKLKGRRRRIVMELKWTGKQISKKDRVTLDKFVKSHDAQMAYFVRVVKPGCEYEKLGSHKKEFEKYRLREIPIMLDLKGAELERWHGDRESIRKALK